MVKPEEDGQQYGEGYGQEDVRHADIPEIDEPVSIRSREEGSTCRQIVDLDALHPADVDEAREKYNGQRGAIVLDEDPDITMKQYAAPQSITSIGDGEDQDRRHRAQVEGLCVAKKREDLYTFLEVDPGDVEAKNVAGKTSDIFQPVARVGDSENPVQNERPEADPGHEGEVVDAGGRHDVEYCVVEDSDRSSDANDDEWLAS